MDKYKMQNIVTLCGILEFSISPIGIMLNLYQATESIYIERYFLKKDDIKIKNIFNILFLK